MAQDKNTGVIYSDVSLSAGIEPSEKVLNAEAVNQNIISIFETPLGSKWFRPKIGSTLEAYLFDPVDDITASRIRNSMAVALSDNEEYRILLEKIDVVPDAANSQYFVNIVYSAPELDITNYSFTFNIARGLN